MIEPKVYVTRKIALGDKVDAVHHRRKEAKQKTLQARKEHNRKLRELDKDPPNADMLT